MSSKARTFGVAQRRAFEQTEAHLETLAGQYARVVRRAGRRAAARFVAGNVVAAADPGWTVPPVSELLDVTQVEHELYADTEKTRTAAAVSATRPILSAMGVSFALEAPMVKDLLNRTGVRAVALSIPGLRDAVQSALTEAFREGLSVPQTAELIRSKCDGLAAYQSEMLARTDLIGTANGGSLLAAKAVYPTGNLTKRWTNATNSRTRNDGHIRPTHLEANAQAVPIDGYFVVGGDRLLFPGDPAGSDAEVCNCRCTIVYEEAGDVSAGGGVVPVAMEADHFWPTLGTAWDETKHPRHPSGSNSGGRFRSLADVQNANPTVELRANERDDGVEMSLIRSETPGQGDASRALDDVVEYAHEQGKNVYLTPEPLGEGLSAPQLREWYRRHGFEKAGRKMEDQAFSHAMVNRAPVTGSAWDESKHPRHPRGEHEGGRFSAGEDGTQAAEVKRGTGWDDPMWAPVRKKYAKWYYGAGGEPLEDEALDDMAKIAGYDALPKQMTQEQMDALPDGWRKVYRGFANSPEISASDAAREFATGDYWAGKGAFGNGTYFTDMKREAEGYAGLDGVVVEAAIPPDALLSDQETMSTISGQERDKLLKAQALTKFPGDSPMVEEQRHRWWRQASLNGDAGARLISDSGRTAVSRGLDGYVQGGGFNQGGGTFYVMHNRGAIFVSDRYYDRATNTWRSYATGEKVTG